MNILMGNELNVKDIVIIWWGERDLKIKWFFLFGVDK